MLFPFGLDGFELVIKPFRLCFREIVREEEEIPIHFSSFSPWMKKPSGLDPQQTKTEDDQDITRKLSDAH